MNFLYAEVLQIRVVFPLTRKPLVALTWYATYADQNPVEHKLANWQDRPWHLVVPLKYMEETHTAKNSYMYGGYTKVNQHATN